jgi:predicted nuclease of predicted toxin-antitoxin system
MLKFIVDESCGIKLAEALQREGYDTVPVIGTMTGTQDREILEKAFREERIVITNDKDFGELVYRQGLDHAGVILLRLEEDSPIARISIVKKTILRFQGKLKGRFVVATEKKIRVR